MIVAHIPGSWLTVGHYAFALALCVAAAFQSHGRATRGWTGLAAILLLLLINRACGIETLVAGFGRALAKADGYYEIRRPFQAAAILALLAVLPAALRRIRGVIAHHALPLRLATLCTAGLLAFVAARTLSFHYLDKLLALGPSFIKLNGLIENMLVCGVWVGGLLALLPGRVQRFERAVAR